MRHERPLLYAITLTLLALVTLPYLYAWHLTPPGHVYTGLLWLPDDQNVHLTWAKQASEGHFLLPNLYSSDTLNHQPTFSNLVLYAVGLTARLTHAPLILIYHFYRLLFTALTILTFHRLTTLLTNDARVRLTATFLVAFSAGFGYLAVLLSSDPRMTQLMDVPRGYLFVPEAYTFTSALIYPLNVASLFLQCATYYFLLLSHRTQKLRYAIYAGLAALVLGNSHTYDSLPLLATLGLFLLFNLYQSLRAPRSQNAPFRIQNSEFSILLTLFLASLPVAIQAWLYFFNPEFRYSKTHYPVTPLPLLPTLLSFGPLVPLAAYGAYLTRRHTPSLLMSIWATITLLLMYSPGLDFGRKLVEGFQLPLAYLAAAAFVHLVSRLRVFTSSRPSFILQPSSFILFFLSATLSLPLILTQILHHRTDPSWPAPRTPLDLPADYAAALDYLDHLPPGEKATAVVVAMPPISNHIPPRTGVHTYVGHWAESIRFVSKYWTTQHFFNGTMSPEDTAEFLAKNHLTHVLQSPAADPPTPTPPATRLSLPPPLFQSHDTAIYRLPSLPPTRLSP